MLIRKVIKSGNTLGVTVPQEVFGEIGCKFGDYLVVEVVGKTIRMRKLEVPPLHEAKKNKS